MNTYVALLRGINVGGHKQVAMADLRALAARLGYARVATWIQSGNLVFASADPAEAIAPALSAGIAADLGVPDVAVVTRAAGELAAVLDANPFPEARADPKTLVVYFLDRPPSPDAAAALVEAAHSCAPERLAVVGREVYAHLPDGQGRASLPALVGRYLKGHVVTARNWRTVEKLRAMAAAAVSAHD